MSTDLAFFMLPIMNAGSVLGRMVGFVADKWGRFVFSLWVFFVSGGS